MRSAPVAERRSALRLESKRYDIMWCTGQVNAIVTGELAMLVSLGVSLSVSKNAAGKSYETAIRGCKGLFISDS